MITFYLKREKYGAGYTIGSLSTPTQKFVTLEDTVREKEGVPVCDWKEPGCTAIPFGTYPLILDMSTRFKKIMPHICNVPGFEGIRIHAGNTAEDTEGCVLLGWSLAPEGDAIRHSRAAIENFMEELEGLYDSNTQVQIEVS